MNTVVQERSRPRRDGGCPINALTRICFKAGSIVGMEPEHVVRMGLGWVPQEENIFPSMTVAENLEMGAYILGGDLRERFDEVSAIFPASPNYS